MIDPIAEGRAFEGFGTSLNAWFPELREHYGQPEFRRFYLEELGATVLRVDLHGDVVPEREHFEELSYRDFVLTDSGQRGALYLDVAEALTRDSAGNLRVIASVWSPPAWMKVNATNGNGHPGRKNFALSAADLGIPPARAEAARADTDPADRERYLLSNKLRKDRYLHFAKSLVEWVRLYRSRGVELYALSPQNEPRFSHWFGSAVYTPTELVAVVEAIVRMFEREGESMPRLFAPETMMKDTEGNRPYVEALLGSPVVAPHLHALAVHGYVDGYEVDRSPESPGRFAKLVAGSGRAIWLTEGGTGGHEWPAPLEGLALSLVGALSMGNASLVTPWQVVDREANTHGLMPLSGPTRKTATAQQFFRFFRPGMRKVKVSSSEPKLEMVAMSTASETGPGLRPTEVALVVVNRLHAERRVRLLATSGKVRVESIRVTDRNRAFAPVQLAPAALLTIPGEAVVSCRLEVSAASGASQVKGRLAPRPD